MKMFPSRAWASLTALFACTGQCAAVFADQPATSQEVAPQAVYQQAGNAQAGNAPATNAATATPQAVAPLSPTVTPALSGETGAGAFSESSPLEEGAKSLFALQMDKPGEVLNLGVQYWIELHRGQQVLHVNNKMAFQTGDKIRFHIRPNVSGFAYILLRSGSQGEQSVLFPDAGRGETNRISAGKDYTLPASDFLQFDNNPGIEKLSLVISRHPLDAAAYLRPAEAPTLIASALDGSKDLIPSSILIAYNPNTNRSPAASRAPVSSNGANSGPPVSKHNVAQRAAQVAGSGSTSRIGRQNLSRQPVHASRIGKSRQGGDSRPNQPPEASHRPTVAPLASNGSVTTSTIATQPPAGAIGPVTVVKKDPTGILAVDIALEHL